MQKYVRTNFESHLIFSHLSRLEGSYIIWLPKVFRSAKFGFLILTCIYTRNEELWNCFYRVLHKSGFLNICVWLCHWWPALCASSQTAIHLVSLQRDGASKPFFATFWLYSQSLEMPALTTLGLAQVWRGVESADSTCDSQRCVSKPLPHVACVACHPVGTEHSDPRNLWTMLHRTLKQDTLPQCCRVWAVWCTLDSHP